MTRVKICGLRTQTEIEAANQCGPDYVGFVFAPGSKRFVTPETATELRRQLHPKIQTVCVFVNKDPGHILQICRQGTISAIQLHGDESEAYARHLRSCTGAPLIRAVPVSEHLPESPAEADFLLCDTASPGRGGTGRVFDWHILKPIAGVPGFWPVG